MPALAKLRPRVISDEELRGIVWKAMQEHFASLCSKGRTGDAATPQEFYGFQPEDVAELHFHQHGVGRGVWYRLKDGRVIDALGKPAHNERHWYVAPVH
jgi:hypothetical protein